MEAWRHGAFPNTINTQVPFRLDPLCLPIMIIPPFLLRSNVDIPIFLSLILLFLLTAMKEQKYRSQSAHSSK